MRKVTYSMGTSLDGYIVGPDGGFDWGTPDEEVHRFANDEVREVGVHLMGRRLYETMLYWETVDLDPSVDDVTSEFASLWRPLPKVVFSNTLSAALGLIDEYRARVCPVLVGGGTPFFPQADRQVELELLDTRTFCSEVTYYRYRVRR